MNENLTTFKTTMITVLMALGAFLGWKGIMAVVWVGVMALDYISGTFAACKNGQWCSAVAREGLWHKLGMIIAVCVAAIADGIMAVICANVPVGIEWPGIILPLVLAWYIITELGSILENVVKMDAPVPAWLTKIIYSVEHVVDEVGEGAVPEHKTNVEAIQNE